MPAPPPPAALGKLHVSGAACCPRCVTIPVRCSRASSRDGRRTFLTAAVGLLGVGLPIMCFWWPVGGAYPTRLPCRSSAHGPVGAHGVVDCLHFNRCGTLLVCGFHARHIRTAPLASSGTWRSGVMCVSSTPQHSSSRPPCPPPTTVPLPLPLCTLYLQVATSCAARTARLGMWRPMRTSRTA